MKRTTLATLALAGVAASVNALASGIGGDASAYNVFIFGSGAFNSENTDTTGDMAVGGNVSLMNYSVASSIAGNPSATPNPARIVVGGTLNAQNGGVGSNQQGAIYTNNTPSLSGFTATGGVHSQTLISSFAADATTYTNLSTSLGALTPNGTASLSAGNTLTVAGSSSSLNVIDLSAASLTSSQTINISAPAGSTVLINVSGSSATFQNGQVNESRITDATVLYNFFQATTVDLAGSKDPEGSILAPDAGVVGGYGQMHGQLIAASYGGSSISDGEDNTQFDNVVFSGSLPTVPLPASGWLLLSSLLGVGGLVRARAK